MYKRKYKYGQYWLSVFSFYLGKIKNFLTILGFFVIISKCPYGQGWVLTLVFYRNITYKVVMLLKNYKFYSYITTLDE